MANIRLYDANGEIAAVPVKAKFTLGRTRISQYCAANQRQLDGLIALNPQAVRAEIDNLGSGVTKFEVRNNRSQAVW